MAIATETVAARVPSSIAEVIRAEADRHGVTVSKVIAAHLKQAVSGSKRMTDEDRRVYADVVQLAAGLREAALRIACTGNPVDDDRMSGLLSRLRSADREIKKYEEANR